MGLMWSTRVVCLQAGLLVLSGCAPGCPAGLSRVQGVSLYFGGSLSEAAWAGFAADTLTPAFPDGFTVYDAGGQWRAPGSQAVVREHTRVVAVFGRDLLAGATLVAGRYRARFHQVSVGIVAGPACAGF